MLPLVVVVALLTLVSLIAAQPAADNIVYVTDANTFW
jgi:hypothetical protein